MIHSTKFLKKKLFEYPFLNHPLKISSNKVSNVIEISPRSEHILKIEINDINEGNAITSYRKMGTLGIPQCLVSVNNSATICTAPFFQIKSIIRYFNTRRCLKIITEIIFLNTLKNLNVINLNFQK